VAQKKRLDILVHERGLAPSREMAQRYILAGEITVDGQLKTKPGMQVPTDAELVLKEAARFVSRGGLKLQAALEAFAVNVNGRVCADVGASTGGFTDCLLHYGAARIYAIDVGYGQLAAKLRHDPRVIVMERANARLVERLAEPVDLAVMDVSFISLRLLLPVVRGWLNPHGEVIALIKPQFEAGKQDVGKGGIVKNPAVHRRVLEEVLGAAQAMGYAVHGLIASPLTGPKGNREFLARLTLQTDPVSGDLSALRSMINAVIPPTVTQE
jgi:23S rRNA (cytidine1920-2'-O)/16S rRNA (cytidine1409-2'-O)-methyltransferase